MQKAKRVAILQHDFDSAMLSKFLLEPLGYKVEILNYADDPVVKIKQDRPDVLIIDLHPHSGHCWSLLDCLAADPDTSCLPVVAITYLDKTAEAALAYASICQVVPGPFSIDELAEKVKAAIRARPKRQDKSA